MTVTAIVMSDKSKYKIFLNDEFAFVLYKGELRKYGIEEGIELSENLYNEIMNELLTKRAKLRAMNLLKSRDYTEAMLKRKLAEGLYPPTVVDTAIEYVKSYNYINDSRYTENYIRLNKDNMSINEMKRKLTQKGIDSEVIAEVVEASYDGSGDSDELIRKLILKKCPDLNALDYSAKSKLLAYMYRKGFSPDSVERVIRNMNVD